jgi:hypothetical protein
LPGHRCINFAEEVRLIKKISEGTSGEVWKAELVTDELAGETIPYGKLCAKIMKR